MARVSMFNAQVVAQVAAAAQRAKVKIGVEVEAEAKRLLSAGGGSEGEPSPPGQPPHVQTGALRSSVAHAIDGEAVIVGPTERYGAVHEFGGRYHPERPFMRPALMNVSRDMPDAFRGIL